MDGNAAFNVLLVFFLSQAGVLTAVNVTASPANVCLLSHGAALDVPHARHYCVACVPSNFTRELLQFACILVCLIACIGAAAAFRT